MAGYVRNKVYRGVVLGQPMTVVIFNREAIGDVYRIDGPNKTYDWVNVNPQYVHANFELIGQNFRLTQKAA